MNAEKINELRQILIKVLNDYGLPATLLPQLKLLLVIGYLPLGFLNMM